MLRGIYSTPVFVTDQDRAVDFYVKRLGFTLRSDQPMGPDARWIEVTLDGTGTALILYKATPEAPGAASYEDAQARLGKFTGISFWTDDLQGTYTALSERGVTFSQAPVDAGWGTMAVLNDPDGNSFLIVQQAAGAVEAAA